MRIVLFAVILIGCVGIFARTIKNISQRNGSVLQILLSTIGSIIYCTGNPEQLATLSTPPICRITGNRAKGMKLSTSTSLTFLLEYKSLQFLYHPVKQPNKNSLNASKKL